MNDKKIEQPTIKPRWKHWHFKSRIVLMLLGALAVIIYVFQAGLAKQYAGLGAALCAVACGLFLVWHAIHLFAEQDALDEQQLNEAAGSSPQLNPADKE
jgi:hypothetical protein